jgi:hypothetical protein
MQDHCLLQNKRTINLHRLNSLLRFHMWLAQPGCEDMVAKESLYFIAPTCIEYK